jgi:hypothetical protein
MACNVVKVMGQEFVHQDFWLEALANRDFLHITFSEERQMSLLGGIATGAAFVAEFTPLIRRLVHRVQETRPDDPGPEKFAQVMGVIEMIAAMVVPEDDMADTLAKAGDEINREVQVMKDPGEVDVAKDALTTAINRARRDDQYWVMIRKSDAEVLERYLEEL